MSEVVATKFSLHYAYNLFDDKGRYQGVHSEEETFDTILDTTGKEIESKFINILFSTFIMQGHWF